MKGVSPQSDRRRDKLSKVSSPNDIGVVNLSEERDFTDGSGWHTLICARDATTKESE